MLSIGTETYKILYKSKDYLICKDRCNDFYKVKVEISDVTGKKLYIANLLYRDTFFDILISKRDFIFNIINIPITNKSYVLFDIDMKYSKLIFTKIYTYICGVELIDNSLSILPLIFELYNHKKLYDVFENNKNYTLIKESIKIPIIIDFSVPKLSILKNTIETEITKAYDIIINKYISELHTHIISYKAAIDKFIIEDPIIRNNIEIEFTTNRDLLLTNTKKELDDIDTYSTICSKIEGLQAERLKLIHEANAPYIKEYNMRYSKLKELYYIFDSITNPQGSTNVSKIYRELREYIEIPENYIIKHKDWIAFLIEFSNTDSIIAKIYPDLHIKYHSRRSNETIMSDISNIDNIILLLEMPPLLTSKKIVNEKLQHKLNILELEHSKKIKIHQLYECRINGYKDIVSNIEKIYSILND